MRLDEFLLSDNNHKNAIILITIGCLVVLTIFINFWINDAKIKDNPNSSEIDIAKASTSIIFDIIGFFISISGFIYFASSLVYISYYI